MNFTMNKDIYLHVHVEMVMHHRAVKNSQREPIYIK